MNPAVVTDRGALVSLAAAALRGVDHLHRHGLVHGDLAPPNLLATGHEETPVKILDLGAGGEIGTGGGGTSGVLAYAAPERLEARGLSVQSDLWSLGAVLFGLVHGCHPFPDYPRQSKIGGGPQRDGLSDDPLDPWLDRLLAEHPEDRFPSAHSALEALADLSGQDVCTLPAAELHAGLMRPPMVDTEALAERVAHQLGTQADLMQAATFTLGGGGGTGRTRSLTEIAHRLSSRGCRVIFEQVLPTDEPASCLQRLLGRLGASVTQRTGSHDAPMACARELLAATQTATRPVALLVDDVDRGGASLRRAMAFVRDSIKQQPDRIGPLLWITVDDSIEPDHRLMPWTTDMVEGLLERIYPNRRVGARVAGPLTTVSRGLPGLLLPHLHRLAQRGHLGVSAAAVQIEDEAVNDEALEVGAATERIEALPPDVQHEACLLAHARDALPVSLLSSDARVTLNHQGLTVVQGIGPQAHIALRSADLIEAARQRIDPKAAAAALATRWDAWPVDPARASVQSLSYRVLSGDEGALEEARTALVDAPEGPLSDIVGALLDAEWPVTSDHMIAVGDAMRRRGDPDQAVRLYAKAADQGDDNHAVALCRQGALEAHRARHAQAIEAFEGALASASQSSRADALAGLARSAVLTGRLDEADRWCQDGLAITEATGERTSTTHGASWAGLTYTAGLIAWYRGELGP
ncbi:MAG: protein kinase family protein, partial [Myxococcota bacterium]|nr:protein kinase family protein [Myxococcota bacterium]